MTDMSSATDVTVRPPRRRRQSDTYATTSATQKDIRLTDSAGASLEMFLALTEGVQVPEPSIQAFESMPPIRLAAWVHQTNPPDAVASDAAEVLGRTAANADLEDEDAEAVFRVLTDLLRRDAPTVREGAVYGIARLISAHAELKARACTLLTDVATSDSSPGVREAASESLEDFDG